MNSYRQRGKKLSPLTVLRILSRAKKGERISQLAEEYAVNRATINRWLAKWGDEATFVDRADQQKMGA